MVLDNPTGLQVDPRVHKESRALCAAGFDVGVVCLRAKPEEPEKEVLDSGFEVYRTNLPLQKSGSRFVSQVQSALGEPVIRKEWVESIRVFFRSFQPDIVHCHDLPLLPTTVKIADESGLPVVADLHENMPALMVASVSASRFLKRVLFRLTFRYRKWRQVEKRVLAKCRKIIVVVPEALQRIVFDYHIPQDRTLVVSNTEDETTFDLGEPDPEIVRQYRDFWAAAYVGGIGPHRGIDTAIRAAAIVGRRIPNFRLLIVGGGRGRREKMLEMGTAEKASDFIALVEWVPYEKVNSYIAASQACLVPHNSFEHTQTTVPHKLFQYMIMSKPVVVSSCAPLKRIVEETQAGLVFRANDAKALAHCLIDLHANERGCMRGFGENGRRAALGPFAWRHDAKRLIDMYRDLESESHCSTFVSFGAR
jgi:glycosyltransferase involved in cell wall biosynthesis